ncbi:MAG: FAD-dependent oxidoreductase [Pseudomonadota bacterium]
MAETKPPADVNYTFSEAELDQLMAYGELRAHQEGELLVSPGDHQADCLVTLSGETHIFVDSAEGKHRRGYMERGQFAGDISVLTGQASLAWVTMGKAGELLHIPYARLQRLLVENSQLSDAFVRTFTARRAFALSSKLGAVIVIGTPYDRSLFSIRDFLTRHSVPHTWLDPDTDPLTQPIMDAKSLASEDLPAVVLSSAQMMCRPTVNELAESLGFDLLPDGASADVIVVGAGPAGLASAVYAGSEGLSVLALDAEGPGGQAGTSSKIENYLGFPTGISGRELADRASVQAQKFGVRIAAPARAESLEMTGSGEYCLRTRDGRALKAKAVVIATGAQYRRLPIERLEDFEGRGVYYGASSLEAQLCSGSRVAIVGAGNSAGQGAVYLSQTAEAVHVIYRRDNIRDTMSEYLVRRLEETPNIHLHPGSQITALHGKDQDGDSELRLTGATLEESGASNCLDTPFVFLFIGAAPFTNWLPDTLRRDEKGFVKTGASLGNLDLVRAGWALERLPTTFETSLPRVYAVGDVRAASVKRVASAVGEGSVVVSDVHRALNELAETQTTD